MSAKRQARTGGMDARGRFKTVRQFIGADGLPCRRQFTQRKGETAKSVILRADRWVVEMKGNVPGPNLSLAKAMEVWLEYKAGQGRADRTLETYRYVVGIICSDLGSVKLGAVTAYMVDALIRRHLSTVRTAKNIRDVGRNSFRWFMRNKWVSDNPFRDSDPVPYEPAQWEAPMSAAHFDAALSTVKNQTHRAILLTLRWTGIRPAGLCELLWANLEERQDGLWVKKRVKTKASERWVPVPTVAAEAIRQLPRVGLFLFVPQRGSHFHIQGLEYIWMMAQKRAGLVHRPLYDLRHLRATELFMQGVPDKTRAHFMGHTSSKTTDRHYVGLDSDHLRRAAEGN